MESAEKLLKKLEIMHKKTPFKDAITALHASIKEETLAQNEIIEVLETLPNRSSTNDADEKHKLNQAASLEFAYQLKNCVDCFVEIKANIDSVAHSLIEHEYDKFKKLSMHKNDLNNISVSERQQIEEESTSFIEYLISKGFNFDAKNQFKCSAVYNAIQHNLQHILPVLLSCTKEINFIDKENRTLLHLFLERHTEASEYRTFSIDENWYKDRYAADIVKILIDKGVSFKAIDNFNTTPFETAVRKEVDVRIIELFVELYTKIELKENDYNALLGLVIKSLLRSSEKRTNYHLKLLLLIRDKRPNESADKYSGILYYSFSKENSWVVNFLQENCSDFTINDGKSLQHLFFNGEKYAETFDDEDVTLIDAFISKSATNVRKLDEVHHGTSPIYILIVKTCYLKVAARSTNMITNFSASTNGGKVLMHLRAESNDYEKTGYSQIRIRTLEIFLKEGCQINKKYETGMTAMHIAAMKSNSTICRILIEHGADIDCRNNQRETPLHTATKNSQGSKIVKLLLEYGSDIYCRNDKKQTPLHIATRFSLESRDLQAVIVLLLQYGVNVNAKDLDRHTVLDKVIAMPRNELTTWMLQSFIKCGAVLRFTQNYKYRFRRTSEKCERFLESIDEDDLLSDKRELLQEQGSIAEFYLGKDHWYKHHSVEYYEACSKEIETMKSFFIDSRTSLHTLLLMNLSRRLAFINNEKLKQLVSTSMLEEQFPKCYILILAKYNETVMRYLALKRAKDTWLDLTNILLPDICLHDIFSFLSNEELYNLIEKN